MSKVLEDFKIVKFKTINAGYDYGYKVWDEIEQALQRLEAIDNANPSEALNKLLDRANHDEYLGRIETDKAINFLNENQAFANTIKQILIKAQEQEKENAKYKKKLEIIFCKAVSMGILMRSKTCKEYNDRLLGIDPNLPTEVYFLTEEEFDILKK